MIDIFVKLAPSALVGVLLGFGLIVWIDPTTGGGSALLIFISTVLTTVVGGIASFFLKRKR